MTRPAVITFYSYKGGVGRTLLAANIAVALAARGKTLLWDLDAEAPGMHHIRALRSEGVIKQGFFEWLLEWQANRGRNPGKSDLERFSNAIRRTPFTDLTLLPAHGDDTDAGKLYFSIDWRYWLGEEPARACRLFESLLQHLGTEGYRHIVLDSRTGLTDLGALIAGVLPDATVLVGGYSRQNLNGLASAWKALKRDNPEIRVLRAERPAPELFLVASPIPQNDPHLVATGKKLWVEAFGLDLASVHEIPFDPELPFSEALLIGQPEREVAKAYRRLFASIEDLLERREEGENLAEEERRGRPDVFEPERGDPRTRRLRKGRSFEKRVADLLALLGYTVEHEQLIDSNRVDLVASIQSGVDVATYLVECKDHNVAIGKQTLEILRTWLDQPKARAMNARGMAVARRFSPAAIAYGKDHGLRLLTPEDLERQLVDFGPFLSRQIAAFEGSTLAGAYVTQRARSGTEGSKTSPDKQSTIDDLVAHGVEWAHGGGNRLWVLLGDYGTGKTAYSQKLAYELAKRAREDRDAPVPLLINLRESPNKVSLEDVLHEYWQRVGGERKDPKLFLHLIARGRVTLLLDSFDEMGVATAGRSVVEQLRSLVRLTGEPGETDRGNRVLVTCREQFFREHGEAVRAAAGSDDRMSELQRVALSFDGAIDVLERFTEAQIREYLVKRLGATEGEKAAQFLREHYLEQLADRPQLLDIIIKSLPRLRQEELTSGKQVTTAALYQAYTNEWLSDLKPVERQSGSEQLRTILELLAGVLWGRVGNRIHYGDLYALFKDRPDLRGTLDPQQLDIELRTAAFLSRTPDGHYGFSHRSFLEYFLARRIERASTSGEKAAEELSAVLDTVRLTFEACGFIDDLVPDGAPARKALCGALRRILSPADGTALAPIAARVNALWLGYSLARVRQRAEDAGTSASFQDRLRDAIPDGAQLAGANLSGLLLAEIALRKADLREVHAQGTDFTRALLSGANLSGAVLRGATLIETDLSDSRMNRANCSEVLAVGVQLRGVQAVESVWINALLDRSLLTDADFSGADLRAARLAGARGRPTLDGSRIDGATARAADALPPEMVHPRFNDLAGVPGRRSLEGRVRSVAFSPDGTRLASAGADGTVRLWDADTGTGLRLFQGHKNWVWSVVFSPDGTRLASAGDDGTVRLWDADTGAGLRLFEGHNNRVLSVAFSPDGTRLASAGDDGTVRLWDADTGTGLRLFQGHKNGVLSVAFSPDGTRLASAGVDGTVRLWDADTGAGLRLFQGHKNWVWSVAFSPDGARLASASADGTVRLWDADTGAGLRLFEGHKNGVLSVAFSPDAARLASAGDDGTVRLWDADTGAPLRLFEGHKKRVLSVAFSPDGTRLASAGDDGTVRLWDADTGAGLHLFEEHKDRIWSVAFSPDGTRLASVGVDGTVRLWDAASGTLLRLFKGHKDRVWSVAFSPDGTRLASAGVDGTVRLWDAASGAPLRLFEEHKDWIWSVAFSPDGARLASASADGTVRLWDAGTGAGLRLFEGHKKRVLSVAFSPDGARLASAGDDGTVRLWDAVSGALLRLFEEHKDRIWSVAFSPDGARLASASADGTVRLWDAASGTLLRLFKGHKDRIWSVAFSSDGTRLASAGDDRTVRLWDAGTGAGLRFFEGHKDWVRSVAFSPDGTRLASAGDDGTVRLWDAHTADRLLVFGAVPRGWFSLDYHRDPRGRWRGEGEGLEWVTYRDENQPTLPAPWIPRDWRAVDLPELAAED